MTVYSIYGVIAEHLNHMGVGRHISVHLHHIAAAFHTTPLNFSGHLQGKIDRANKEETL